MGLSVGEYCGEWLIASESLLYNACQGDIFSEGGEASHMVKKLIKSFIESILDSSKEDSDKHVKVTQNAVGKDITQIGVQNNYGKERRSKRE